MNQTETHISYRHVGHCPICESQALFVSKHDWYRDHLICTGCRSIPRERALALILMRKFSSWRNLAIHESSPVARGISLKMKAECAGYIATQYYPERIMGDEIGGFRNENLEKQTFSDQSFDIVVTLDVMEHVNQPEICFKEIARTLRQGGAYIFTAPTYKGRISSERRALYEGENVTHFADPEYHGNPISDAGSLVTFHYGYDLPDIIYRSSGLDVEVVRFHDHRHGIIGEFTEVYIASQH